MTSTDAGPAHLVLVSLGPIQDFIASARRCQDLWYGSWMLSELARTVAEALQARAGTTLVFPGALGNDKPAVANKVLAVVPGDGAAAQAAVEAAETAMRKRLDHIAQEAFARIWDEPFFHGDVAMQQVADLMEYHWVAVPMARSADYQAARDQAEEALASIKRSRLWGAVSWTGGRPGVPKSSLDGLRESVIDEQCYDAIARGRMSAEHARRMFGIRSTERLCGVGLLKRLGVEMARTDESETTRAGRRPPFHSTSHVAATPLLARLATTPGAEEAFREYCNVLRDCGIDLGRFVIRGATRRTARFESPFGGPPVTVPHAFGPDGLDGQILFDSRLESVLEEQTSEGLVEAPKHRAKRLQDMRRALKNFLNTLGAAPCPYYALLLADGDNMGAAIDGLARTGGLEAHQALSAALERFSAKAAQVVGVHGGSLIYAGGDDVLAMLPLHTALRCARRLHDDFAEEIRQPVASLSPDVKRPTLSVGLALVHHLEPFGEAREWARKAESAAKAHPDKDALAVVAVPRSGAETMVVSAWKKEPDRELEAWVVRFAQGDVSHKAPHDLLSALEPLRVGLKPDERAALKGVVASLARRVVAAKRQKGGGAHVSQATREALTGRFEQAEDPFEEVTRLVHELFVAQALLPGYVAAFGRPASGAPAAGAVRPEEVRA